MVTMAAMANKACRTGMRTRITRQAPCGAFSVLMTALIASSLCQPAFALDWNFTPTLNNSATFTDNVKQSASNRESGLILSVTPGFTLVSKGSRRVQASVGYGLSGVARFGGDNSTDLNHNLSATGKAELVEDFLFLDGSANISQELISLLGSPADANTNSSNRATVGTYSFSPYVQKRLGTFATAQARYTHSGAIFGDHAGSNIASDALTASLGSGTRFNDFNWGLNYSLRQAEYADNGATRASNATFESTSATLGYALSRKFRVFTTVGRDSNDFINASQSNGNFYTAGFGWSPSRRTSLDASAGKRFLGNTFSLSLLHSSHFSNWNIKYSEDVSDISQQILTDTGKSYLICALASGDYFITSNLTLSGCSRPVTSSELIQYRQILGITDKKLLAGGIANSSLAQGVYLIKSFTSGVSWSKGRIGAGFSVFDTRRNYLLLTQFEDRTQGISVNANYRLTPKTRVTSILTFTNNQVPAGFGGLKLDRDDNIYTASLGVDHRFDSKVTGTLTLRRQQRESNDPAASFDENSITASLYMRF